ncbi:relaxase/mobilization nuclease domain-containing protein [Rufibacter sp. LB8]|uniref:relaxase/mobilization nuclease domain-containing protein n=1 Tax=Rufibacter sp. LB8 TaxID=2777781 RepID=UPI00351C9BA0
MAQGKAQLILASRFGAEVGSLGFPQKLRRFEYLTLLNARVKTNALHLMLNFAPTEKPSLGLMQQVASSYMEKIGFGEQPYLVYRHFDAAHAHLHIVTTNIRANGSRIDLHNIGSTLSEKARQEIEWEFKLERAAGKSQSQEFRELQPVEYGKEPTRQALSNIVTFVTTHYAFTSLAELNAVLGLYRVTADPGSEGSEMRKKKGLVYAILDEKGTRVGVPFKASALPGKPTLSLLEKRMDRNKAKRQPFKESLATAITGAVAFGVSKKAFAHRLETLGIGTVFRENKQGITYGVTYIDHRHKTVFNGSSLGKAFSAYSLMKRFKTTEETQITDVAPSIGLQTDQQTVKSARPPHQTESGNRLLERLFTSPVDSQSPLLGKKKGKKRKRRFGL